MNVKSIVSRLMPLRVSRAAVFSALITLVTATGLPGSAANASVLYSNFGPGNSYDCCIGWTVSGGIFGPSLTAMSFTPTFAADVSQVDLALNSIVVIGTSAVTISLWTNVGGALGAQLGSWSASAPNSGLLTISGISGVHLSALTSYFLAATESGDVLDSWLWNTTGATDQMIVGFSPTTGTLGAFDILAADVSTTPLPSTWLMLLSGFAGLGFFAYRGTKKNIAALAAA